jgi:hypothetical protein
MPSNLYRYDLTTDRAPSAYSGCRGTLAEDDCHDDQHTSLSCYLASFDPEPPVTIRSFGEWATLTRKFWA